MSRARSMILRGAAAGIAAVAITASAQPSAALTCGESGETPGVIESVLDGTHARTDRWEVIAAGTVTAVEPLDGDYGSLGAWVEIEVAYWFRGGDVQPTLRFFDPPAGGSGVGFEPGASYLVLASEDLSWGGRLATGLCELTHELMDFTRVEQLAAEFGATMPDTALSSAGGSSPPLLGAGLLLLALALGTTRWARSSTA